jgi:hypothetical protein
MADTTTTNYSLTKPEVGASEDTWGTKLNANLDTIDSTIKSVSDAAAAAQSSADTALAKDPVLTLSGDVTGTATFTNLGNATLIATVVDDSHSHIIGNVDGLQTALDSKQAASTALTTTTSFGGDVSGTYNAIVVADDSHNHVVSNVDGLQTALDAKAPIASPTFTGTVNAGDKITLGSWNIWDSGGTLYFQYGTNNVFKIDSSGNITAEANVTAYGTV